MTEEKRVTLLTSEKRKVYESLPFGIVLTLVGGYLDAYTYISRDVFANAQTGNVVLMGIHASNGEWAKAFTYLLPILSFVLGVLLVEVIKSGSVHLLTFTRSQTILILETIILVIVGFIPADFSDIVVSIIISFVAAVQVCAFAKLVDSSYATTMMTGNLRSLSQELYKAWKHQDGESWARAGRYTLILLAFFLGALGGGVLTIETGVHAVWGCAAILFGCVIVIGVTGRKTIRN